MKKYIPKVICFILSLIIGPMFRAAAQTTYDVPVILTLTSGEINRALESQWNSMQHSWTESYQGLDYTILYNWRHQRLFLSRMR